MGGLLVINDVRTNSDRHEAFGFLDSCLYSQARSDIRLGKNSVGIMSTTDLIIARLDFRSIKKVITKAPEE